MSIIIYILFQNTHYKIMIKKMFFFEFGNYNFIVLRSSHPFGYMSPSIILDTSEIVRKSLQFDDPWTYIIMDIVMICLFNIWSWNLYSSTEHPVSYYLIFNLNIITTIFRLGNHTCVHIFTISCISLIMYISSSTRDLHSLCGFFSCR